MFAIIAAILLPILRIVSALCTCYGNNTCYLCDLQENKDALDIAMEELKDARDDVKRKVDEAENNPDDPMKSNQEVSGWIQRVEAIEVKVVKVIKRADKEIKGRCFGGCCPKNCWSASKTGKRVIQTLAIVKDFKSQGIKFVDVAHKLPPPSVQNQPVNLPVGRDFTLKQVLELIDKDETRIIGLYGQGGVGKTTLLKQINNKFLESTTTSSTHGFDIVIYVVVSKEINIGAILKEIGNRLGLLSPNTTNIHTALKNQRFLLLLDDIWAKVDLISIGIPVPHPENKSKVVFTTRSETVCGLMEADKRFRVECLPWDKAWTLFQEKVGNETLNSHPRVPELAKIVARECGGLPLALITIGRAMSTKKTVREWNHAITTLRKSASEFPGMGDEVLPLLRLSYDSLRNDTIKSCFLYCALFPEDHSIDKSKLVDYWIGEGLIILDESDHIDDARNHGHDVIGILKGACLLETGRVEGTEVKMHDTIRDLALWIKKDKMVIAGASEHTSERLWFNAERVYYFFGTKIAPPNSPILQTLLVKVVKIAFEDAYRYQIFPIPNNFFEFMPLLRVLDLSGSGVEIETFPISITKLLELQYLNLSNTHIKVLPKKLRNLVKLRYLDLSFTWNLKEIPSGVIGSLLELRVLNVGYSYTEWDIEEGYNLKYLNDLRMCINTQQNLNKLLSNQNLPKCVRHLALYCFNGAELMNHYYYSIEQQQHIGSCFQNLSEIEIYYCHELKDLTWVGYVGNLKTLFVYQCNELEEIVKVADDIGGSTRGGGGDEIAVRMNNVQHVFKSLETLKLWNLPKLKSICRNALAFPCLKYIEVDRCPQLKKLPFDSASNINNTLQEIKVDGEQEWWTELQWEDGDNIKTKFHYSGRTWQH